MKKYFLVAGSLFGLTAVILGAFGAHALEKILDTAALDSFETGVRYQMYHALLLLLVGTFNFLSEKSQKIIFYLLLFGIILFSGSIYLLVLFELTQIALLTPLGGGLLIVAWVVLLITALKKTGKTEKSS
ncbi:MAG TPA: DUF423 domain-containing protein [Flavobacteriaceae bacterium]|nr:DUF423 domain-containing protein [Flavobacteriaceae bacterium]